MSDTEAPAATHHGHTPHVVPLKLMLGTAGALMVLTVLTVAVTWVDLGDFNLAVALIIAIAKATLVALIFMHLLWDKPLNAIFFVAAIGFVFLFVLLATMDTLQYKDTRIEGYAPGIEQSD